MAYSITTVNPHMLLVTITVPQDDIDRAIDAEYKLLARVPRPGFRVPRGGRRSKPRGKGSKVSGAPRSLLEARHGLAAMQPLCLKIMRDQFRKICKEHHLHHAVYLRARARSWWFGGEPLEYEVSFYHRPILPALVPGRLPFDLWELPIGFKFWRDARHQRWTPREEVHGDEAEGARVPVHAGQRGTDSQSCPPAGTEDAGGGCAAG